MTTTQPLTSVSGLISGLDTSSIITQLMQVEAEPQTALKTTLTNTQSAITSYQDLNTKFKALLTRPNADLYKPFLWGTGQNLLREALLIADHNGYHVGELIVLRRLLGAWKK